MKIFEALRNILSAAAVIVMIGALACMIFRLSPAVVKSGSMEPAFHVGSIVMVQKGSKCKIGDPAAFYVGGEYVTHRITGEENGKYITKGDNNNTEDPWRITDEDIVGKIVFTVPLAGYVINYASTKQGMIILVSVMICLILSVFMSGSRETSGLSASGGGDRL